MIRPLIPILPSSIFMDQDFAGVDVVVGVGVDRCRWVPQVVPAGGKILFGLKVLIKILKKIK